MMCEQDRWADLDPNLRVHLEEIYHALNDGRAAVMVGAGFSRNAINGEQMPNWAELGAALFPDKDRPSPAEIPRIAERYVAVHKRHRLDKFLREHIPDQGTTQPSDLHRELLQLNWRDVFTTNYDTLLERAYLEDQDSGDSQIKERYSFVHTIEDIPGSREHFKRRIVKLHGSFPSHRPFIFTEEDYRTYPQKFAPFVNMVRQSMMENVFCLMGFSGDDPNFLAWIGWVRDQLGGMQPRIYLMTTDNFPLGQRELLEARNIICVDIRKLDPSGREGYKDCYTKLLERLSKKPESADDWSYVPHKFWLQERGETATVDEKNTLLRVMREQRQSYPGWIFPPLDVSKRLWDFFERNYYFFKEKIPLKDESNVLSAVLILREKLWLMWLAGIPCRLEFTRRGLALLRLSWPLLPTEDVTFPPNSPWADMTVAKEEIVAAWQEAACILVSFCRQDWQRNWYQKAYDFLCSRPKNLLSANSHSWIAYLDVLRHLERLEPDTARERLKDWALDSNDNSFWPVRRAMLWAELGESERAKGQILNALKNIRRRIQSEGETTYLMSYEQWCLYYFEWLKPLESLTAAEEGQSVDVEEGQSISLSDMRASVSGDGQYRKGSSPETDPNNKTNERKPKTSAEDRFDRVKYMPWHPFIILAGVEADLVSASHAPSRVNRFIDFDLGSRSWRRSLRSGFPPWIHAGFTFLALVEHVCLVPRVRNSYTIEPKMRINAMDLFCQFKQGASDLCLGIILRSALLESIDEEHPTFSRRFVASLSDQTVALLTTNCIKLIQSHFLPSVVKAAPAFPAFFRPYLNFALELLGRLSLRMSQDDRERVLQKAMAWYANPLFVTDPTNRWFAPFFKRVVQSVSYVELASSLEALLTQPLSVPSQPRSHPDFFDMAPDPVSALPDRWPTPLLPLLSSVNWDAVIKNSLDEILREKLSAHPRNQVLAYHWGKLTWMAWQGVLSDREKEKIWDTLREGCADDQWVPIQGNNAWVPLLFAPKGVEDSVWKQYRSFVLHELKVASGNVKIIYRLLCIDQELRDRFIADDDELKMALLEALKPCMVASLPSPSDQDSFGSGQEDRQKWNMVVWLLCFICGPRLANLQNNFSWLPDYLRQFHRSCQQMKIPHLRLELVMASLGMEKFSRGHLLRHIEDNLFTGEDMETLEAGITLLTWEKYFQNFAPLPSLEPLARAFALRRPFNQALCNVLVERQKYVTGPFTQAELDYILPALKHYAETMAYETKSEPTGGEDDETPLRLELPEERWRCGQLVLALWQSNPELHEDPIIQRWVDIMTKDPLAEMRNLAEIIRAEAV